MMWLILLIVIVAIAVAVYVFVNHRGDSWGATGKAALALIGGGIAAFWAWVASFGVPGH